MTSPTFQVVAGIGDAELLAMPIDPAWVVAGDPVATGALPALSPDGAFSAGLWQCTPGEFDWPYEWDEVALVTAGRAQLGGDNGSARSVGPGDLLMFHRGTTVRWRIEETVTKVFVLRTVLP